MKKETAKFITGQQNVTIDNFVLGRERVGNSELILVSLPEYEEPLFALWNSRKDAKKYRKVEIEYEIVFEKKNPKGSGSQKTYVMLMQTAIAELSRNVSLEALGFLLKITPCIEWDTGRIYRKRDQKSMTVDMLSKYVGIGLIKTKNILKELSKNDVIFYLPGQRAYFVNQRYLRKGGGYRAD